MESIASSLKIDLTSLEAKDTADIDKVFQTAAAKRVQGIVVDGSAFVSGGSQNPTLTICALSMRAGDYIAERMRKRDI